MNFKITYCIMSGFGILLPFYGAGIKVRFSLVFDKLIWEHLPSLFLFTRTFEKFLRHCLGVGQVIVVHLRRSRPIQF